MRNLLCDVRRSQDMIGRYADLTGDLVLTLAFDVSQGSKGNQVTWSMDGSNDFLNKFFSLLMDMDQMLGSQFERGTRRSQKHY